MATQTSLVAQQVRIRQLIIPGLSEPPVRTLRATAHWGLTVRPAKGI